MKFLVTILAFIFSFQAQAHTDHFLGDSFAHDLMHAVLIFLVIAIAVTGINWFRKKSK